MCVFACVTIACARTATTQTELRPEVEIDGPRSVTGRFGQDTFRPQFLAESSLISWTFRPQNVNDSANKYERFGQINYIDAEMSLQKRCLSSATLLAAAIVTNVGSISHYLRCHSL